MREKYMSDCKTFLDSGFILQIPCGRRPSAKLCKYWCLSSLSICCLFPFITNHIRTNSKPLPEAQKDIERGQTANTGQR